MAELFRQQVKLHVVRGDFLSFHGISMCLRAPARGAAGTVNTLLAPASPTASPHGVAHRNTGGYFPARAAKINTIRQKTTPIRVAPHPAQTNHPTHRRRKDTPTGTNTETTTETTTGSLPEAYWKPNWKPNWKPALPGKPPTESGLKQLQNV